jgi:hypothetical protein
LTMVFSGIANAPHQPLAGSCHNINQGQESVIRGQSSEIAGLFLITDYRSLIPGHTSAPLLHIGRGLRDDA